MKSKHLITAAVTALALTTATAQQAQLTETLNNHVTILASDSLSGRGFGFPEKHLAIDYITRQYEEAGFAAPYNGSYIHPFNHFLTFALIEGKNIIGIIEGSDPQLKHEYILLGAHFDHMGWKTIDGQKVVWNGADDNASGVAAIIEIGKLLRGNQGSLGRSVIIAAFDGEEAGLLGSSAFVRTEIPGRFDVKMMFSLDMVGMLDENDGINHTGFRSLQGGEALAAVVIERHSLPVTESNNKIEYRTDTWPFAKKDIPAVYVSTGLLSPLHQPEDDAHLLDYEGMSRIVQMMTEMTLELSNMKELAADNRYIARKVDPSVMAGLRVGYGSTLHAHKTEFYNAKPILSAEAGFEAQLRLTRNIRLQPAVMYQLSGSKTDAGKLRTHSVVPQIDLLLTTRGGSIADPTLFLLAGGYYSHSFAGREAGSPADFTLKYDKTDYGLRFGAGVTIMKMQIAFTYKYGLNRVNLDPADGKIFNRGFFSTTTKYF
ncbi:MAG: M28 family peptidase [Bacteroidales bacterium]